MLTIAVRSTCSIGRCPTFGSAPPGPCTSTRPAADGTGARITAWSDIKKSDELVPEWYTATGCHSLISTSTLPGSCGMTVAACTHVWLSSLVRSASADLPQHASRQLRDDRGGLYPRLVEQLGAIRLR